MMKRLIVICFLLGAWVVSAHAQSKTFRWEPSGADSTLEGRIDALSDALWKAQMDQYVTDGIVISSGGDYQLVLPVMEVYPAGVSFFVYGNNILAETRDSLVVRNSTLYAYTITRTDTLAVTPTIAQFQIITWDKRTRAKIKSTPPSVIGKTDAYFVGLYSRQGWISAARRVEKVKTRRRSAAVIDPREPRDKYANGSY